MEDKKTLTDMLNILNGLKEGEVLILDRKTAGIGIRQNGKIKLMKNLGKWGQNLESLNAIGSTSFVTSHSKSGNSFKKDISDERSYKASKRIKFRDKMDMEQQGINLGMALQSLNESKNIRENLTNIGSHLYKVRVTDVGIELYHEVYPRGHNLEGAAKTGEIKYLRFPGENELTKLTLGPGVFQGKLTL